MNMHSPVLSYYLDKWLYIKWLSNKPHVIDVYRQPIIAYRKKWGV